VVVVEGGGGMTHMLCWQVAFVPGYLCWQSQLLLQPRGVMVEVGAEEVDVTTTQMLCSQTASLPGYLFLQSQLFMHPRAGVEVVETVEEATMQILCSQTAF
jgi:hypothetical protein